ncbi:uncharacterized protein I303_105539 [Kwoniella dejecticola CBS 10117]|uniref:Cation efflux protein transmembrane domain-containing protein n=1 Tax=Kwoniella dejecticola CBS 10117 TaxID=1296121 RepID=A0A1A6A271_9TREE|nr:uncharacterized protein I303_05018 [Kwoniella dejecticola CBS 10117]OBR84161.1 hypothetical protein I303_05018 [Kwoniella dejecticola CBS 10117]
MSSVSPSPTTKLLLNGEYFPQQPKRQNQTYSTFSDVDQNGHADDYFGSHSDGEGSSSISKPFAHRRGKGMTIEEVHAGGIISEHERSLDFEGMGIPISEDEMKKLPKKVRGYYEYLSTIHDHYEEVDGLLSGTLPHDIAISFSPQRNYIQRIGDLEDEISGTPGRRHSAWKLKTSRMVRDTPQPDAEERTGLLDGFGGGGGGGGSKEEKRERLAKLALNVNTVANVLLVAAKVVAVLYSSSISLTASLVDSALDLLSTMIILGTSWAIGVKSDKHKYPAGKRRFEPLGVLIFSVAMIASFVQVFIESFERAIGPAEEAAVDLSWLGIGVMLATIGIKSILWVWCSRIPSSGVQALAQDAENDVFFNIMSLAFPWIGSFFAWRLLDPIGGMVLSTYIIVEWIKTLLQNFANLSGKSASRDQITRVLYLVSRFNPVLEIADVECYHIGDDLIVEIDVILPRTSSLHFAHDVGETIQCVLESLDGVIRAYVHCDYSSQNPHQHTSRPAPLPANQLRPSSNGSSDSGTPTPRPTNHMLTAIQERGEGRGTLLKGDIPVESPGEIGI